MYCVKCGQQLVADAKFCIKCGTAVPDIDNMELGNDDIINAAEDILITNEIPSIDNQNYQDDVFHNAELFGNHSQNTINSKQTSTFIGATKYPIVERKTFFANSIVIDRISFSGNDIVYRVGNNKGYLDEDFISIEQTEIEHLFIAQGLTDKRYVFIGVDVNNKEVFYATKTRYEQIRQMKHNLFHCRSLSANELMLWNEDKLHSIYSTLAWIEYVGQDKYGCSYFSLHNNEHREALIYLHNNRIGTIFSFEDDIQIEPGEQSFIRSKSFVKLYSMAASRINEEDSLPGEDIMCIKYKNKSYYIDTHGKLLYIKKYKWTKIFTIPLNCLLIFGLISFILRFTGLDDWFEPLGNIIRDNKYIALTIVIWCFIPGIITWIIFSFMLIFILLQAIITIFMRPLSIFKIIYLTIKTIFDSFEKIYDVVIGYMPTTVTIPREYNDEEIKAHISRHFS